jgi:hypothetical protein
MRDLPALLKKAASDGYFAPDKPYAARWKRAFGAG